MTHRTPLPADVEAVPCRANPEKQFPTGTGPAREAAEHAAKSVCRRGNGGKACPLIDRCLAYSIEWAVEGVWGATTWVERQEIREDLGIVPISITPGTPRATVYRTGVATTAKPFGVSPFPGRISAERDGPGSAIPRPSDPLRCNRKEGPR